MTKETIFLALCYELILEAKKKWLFLGALPGLSSFSDYCFPFWTQWKTETTLQKVDEQAKELVEQWEKEEREVIADKLAAKAQELFPQATITPLPDAIVPSVMIVHEAPPEASDAVKALGGELRITWRLE